jgi:hypothetical protein
MRTPLFENDLTSKSLASLKCETHLSGKTLISGSTSRYTTFTLIVAQRYHQKFAVAATITDQA